MWRAAAVFFPAPCGPGEGSKGQISFNFNYKGKLKVFYIQNFVCVPTNERYKTYQMRYFIMSPGSCPRGATWGA